MKIRNKKMRIPVLLLVLILSLTGIEPVFASENGAAEASADEGNAETAENAETVYINTAEDLLSLADHCRLDTWSQGKTVVLQADISLAGTEFWQIPSFGGVFEGNGFTISGVKIDGSVSPAGFFGYVQETAQINNLNISGDIVPSGDGETAGGIAGENYGRLSGCTFDGTVSSSDNIGGIAGINASSGVIENCESRGVVFGQDRTGGIVGYNMGTVSSCQNDAYVNITSVDPTLNIADINFDSLLSIKNLASLDTSSVSSDTGGVAGYSTGILQNCSNYATIGYQHVGYNVGGIVGRNCGYVYACENKAEVYGRKDVGGIAGQMEPYIALNLSEDTLSKLQNQMDELNGMLSNAMADTEAGVGTLTSRMNKIADYLDSAAGSASNITTYGSVSSTVVGSGETSGSGNVTVTAPKVEIEGSGENGGNIDVEIDASGIDGEGGSFVDVEVSGGLSSSGVDGSGSSSASGSVNASTQITLNTSLGGLTSAVNGMSSQMRMLNSEISGTAGAMTEDLQAISDKINEISDTVFNAMLGTDQEGDILEDTSEVDIDTVTFGKMAAAKNSGTIYGDINVGGIAGAMAIEYELDPEDDLTADISGGQRRSYELKAIIQNCVNEGAVTAKRSYTGGICGRMNLGLITDCQNYGDIESENGDYVGGVAGMTGSTIRGSYAKCTLRGGSYIGGVVGNGTEAEDAASSSTVSGCYTVVAIDAYEQYVGAVSGGRDGTFIENYFVSEELGGMNGVSYTGAAQPVAFSGVQEIAPEEFHQFTLRFVIDEEVVKTVPFSYGDSFDEAVFPELPEKEGYYAEWDKTDLENLCFDTTVTAVYAPYVTALTAEASRSDGRSVFYLEGQFADGQSMTAETYTETPEDFDGVPDGFWEKLKTCLTSRSLGREILEQWKLEIPEDGLKEHTVHYRSDGNNEKHLAVYVSSGDGWNRVETESMGSYLTFPVEGNQVDMIVVSTVSAWWIWLIAAALVALLAAVILLLKKKRIKWNFNWKAENIKKRPVIIALAAVLFCALVMLILYFAFSDIKTDMDAYQLLKKTLDQTQQSMELSVQGKIGEENLEFTVHIDETELEDQKVICVEKNGMKLFYSDGVIFLENGDAYQISENYPDYTELPEQMLELYEHVEISGEERDGTEVYVIEARENDAKSILNYLAPSVVNEFADTQTVTVSLASDGEHASAIEFQASGNLKSEGADAFSLEAVLILNPDSGEEANIPAAVKESILAGTENAVPFEDDLYRLLSAFGELNKREPLTADALLQVDCGPVVISDNIRLYQWMKDDLKIGSIQKNGVELYFTDNMICDRDGNIVTETEETGIEAAEILKFAYELCMSADLKCTRSGERYCYSLVLDEESIEKVVYTAAPSLKDLNVSFGEGSLTLEIEDDRMQSIQLSCAGTVPVMFSDVDAQVSVELTFEETAESAEIPEEVYQLLRGKESFSRKE